jgi:hypothetical protein
MSIEKPNTLLVLWKTAERDTALNMVLMYVYNAKVNGWWQDLTLLIWGSSPRLLCADGLIQKKVDEIKDAGVRVIACKKCAENLGLVDKIEAMGIDVFYTGEFLTDWIKSSMPMITI